MPGPTTRLRPALPKRPTFWRSDPEQSGLEAGQPGMANAAVLYQRSYWRWSLGRFGSPIRSGRPPKMFVFETSSPVKLGVMNRPVRVRIVLVTIQFPMIALVHLGRPLPIVLFLPKGKSQE